MRKIAVLMTCYNRVATTLKCLESLFAQKMLKEWSFELFLVDDNSPDKTGEVVKAKFPTINVIYGDGNLFWSGGMRLAWESAAQKGIYDAFMWLNDDVFLSNGALEVLITDLQELENSAEIGIIAGCFYGSMSSKNITYGVFDKRGRRVVPSGHLQKFDGAMEGNCVLIPNEVFRVVGNIYHEFIHGVGDYDYVFSARKAGFSSYLSSQILGYCRANEFTANMKDKLKKMSLRERINFFYSPKGASLREYCVYKKRHWGNRWILSWINAWLKIFFK